ncbi:MAG: PAS domain S-box protein [Pyrinomonadaceae bacterium]
MEKIEQDFNNNLTAQAIINSLPGVFYLIDSNGRFLSWNDNFERVSGYTAEEIRKIHSLDLVGNNEKELVEAKMEEAFRHGESSAEVDFVSKDGKRTPYFFTGKQIIIDGKVCLLGMGVDISERMKAENALRQSEDRYRAFIKHSNEGIWRFEMVYPLPMHLPIAEQIEKLYENSRLAECNDMKAQQHGFSAASDLIGKSLGEFLVRSDENNKAYLNKFIKSGYHLIDNETHEKDKNGDDKYFLSNLIGIVQDGNLVGIWGAQRDITDIKQARRTYLESEEQLRRSQKVEAIGRLAGGIAHDFNNFLAVIMLHVDMLNLQLPAGSPLRFRIEEIKSVTNNAAATVRQLLAFGRKQTLQPHPIVLNNVAQEFMKILRPLIGEDIEVELNLAPNLGVCFVDPDQITQILMNLAVNARDAMPKGGVLRLETSNIILNKHLLPLKSQPVGEYIQLKVSDNGVGMEAGVKNHIFEPFFTTKEAHKGTGLGLATVYGIVKQSNGFIWVDSKPGQGASFKVQFPRIDQPAKSAVKEETVSMPTGSETILLVEDEESVRRIALEVLNVLGYQVFEAANGQQALQIAEIYNQPIDLLLTDVVMPRMNGRELSEKVKALHPETVVLFMSGYNDDIISNHGALDENIQFLSKPFTPLVLADRVRQILENRGN